MNHLMLRNFDHSGYYETRLILMVISLAIAAYFHYYKRDRRFLLMFGIGALLNVIGKFGVLAGDLNPIASATIFGATLPTVIALICQGVFEGGTVSLFAFWYADLRSAKVRSKEWWPFYGFCAVVVMFAFIVGLVSRGRSITWQRPIFAPYLILIITLIIFFSLMVAWQKNDISSLASFFAGLLLFAILNYEPMHLMGARYIGEPATPEPVAAGGLAQILLMFLSHIFEAAGGKLHYFMLPYAFGWIALREPQKSKRERFSTQHLADLTTRGYRKKSNFTEDN